MPAAHVPSGPKPWLPALTVDYGMQLKQAHWNVKGRQFVALHEMLDAMAGEVNGHADMIAERAVMLGGQALGTLQSTASASKLPAYPVEATAMMDHLSALAESLGELGSGIRDAIDEARRTAGQAA